MELYWHPDTGYSDLFRYLSLKLITAVSVFEQLLSLKHFIQWIISLSETGALWRLYDNWGAVATFKAYVKLSCSIRMPIGSSKFNVSSVCILGLDWENMAWKGPQIGRTYGSSKNQVADGVQRSLDFSAIIKDAQLSWSHDSQWLWKARIFVIVLLALKDLGI